MSIDPAHQFGTGNQPILSIDLADERPTTAVPEDPSRWPVKNLCGFFNRYPLALCAICLGFDFVGSVIPGELGISQ
jgi:hypothetical protein